MLMPQDGQALLTHLDSNVGLLCQVAIHLSVAACRLAGNVLRCWRLHADLHQTVRDYKIMAEVLLDGPPGCRPSILPGTLCVPDKDMVQHIVAAAAHTEYLN